MKFEGELKKVNSFPLFLSKLYLFSEAILAFLFGMEVRFLCGFNVEHPDDMIVKDGVEIHGIMMMIT